MLSDYKYYSLVNNLCLLLRTITWLLIFFWVTLVGKWVNRATLTGTNHNTFRYSVSQYVLVPLRGVSLLITYFTLCRFYFWVWDTLKSLLHSVVLHIVVNHNVICSTCVSAANTPFSEMALILFHIKYENNSFTGTSIYFMWG